MLRHHPDNDDGRMASKKALPDLGEEVLLHSAQWLHVAVMNSAK